MFKALSLWLVVSAIAVAAVVFLLVLFKDKLLKRFQ